MIVEYHAVSGSSYLLQAGSIEDALLRLQETCPVLEQEITDIYDRDTRERVHIHGNDAIIQTHNGPDAIYYYQVRW